MAAGGTDAVTSGTWTFAQQKNETKNANLAPSN